MGKDTVTNVLFVYSAPLYRIAQRCNNDHIYYLVLSTYSDLELDFKKSASQGFDNLDVKYCL